VESEKERKKALEKDDEEKSKLEIGKERKF